MEPSSTSPVFMSIIIPVYNEGENIPILGREIRQSLASLGKGYEVILVDDGSLDRSYDAICELAGEYAEFRGLRLTRNFGQTAALAAGIDASRGEVLAFLDADLQNDPRDIPRMLAKLEEGYDVVSGWRKDRQDSLISRKLPSYAANWIISGLSGPTMWQPTTRWVSASTTSFIRTRSSEPVKAYFIGRKRVT